MALQSLVMVCLAVSLVAQSPPPSPTPTIIAQNQQQHGDSEQPNSTQAQEPILNPIVRDESSEDQRTKSGKESSDSGINLLAWVVAIASHNFNSEPQWPKPITCGVD
jgi:hypothetical protein